MMKIGVSEAIAYRAEMLVWVLSTTMPFINMALWSAVSAYTPVTTAQGRTYGSADFVTYFLCAFIVRQIVSSWASWEINWEVRSGALSMRLLRPMHPIVVYGSGNLAALPMRLLVTFPVVVLLFITGAFAKLPNTASLWALWLLSMFGGWLVTFFINIAIGSLSLFMDSSIKVMDVWLAGFFVFSGYSFPLAIAPSWLSTVAHYMPYRYQFGLPLEMMTGAHDLASALPLLATQWGWVTATGVLAVALWTFGVRRFQAFGG
ncbi:MAG: ABC-2 family transporter protein [Myxococcaceae bacterium]|nr:ABC-2 family transporter protein [Myxococcaceae bacterium]